MIGDSKSKRKDESEMTKEQCLTAEYSSNPALGSDLEFLPISVVAYPFKDHNQLDSHFTGIDLRYKYEQFSNLKLRIKNTNGKVCPQEDEESSQYSTVLKVDHSSSCNPRCVEINNNSSSQIEGPVDSYLSYDCEAGFYKQLNNWISSAGHDYELSLCVDNRCRQFLFQLPDAASFSSAVAEQSLVLVDKTEYDAADALVLWIPTEVSGSADTFSVKVTREVDNMTVAETVLDTNISLVSLERGPGVMRVALTELSLTSGRYQALVTPQGSDQRLLSARLTRPSYTQTALAFVTAILVTLLMVGVLLTIYRQWHSVAEQGAVEPNSLLSAGRMEARRVLVVTSLDSPDHVEVVRHFCRYLKDWCGVGSTYFAFDEATGIGVEQNDPWKWCQETCDKVKDDGTVVYIAGPDPSLANNTSIFPNLEQNQAFVMTRHLPVMAREGRVIVVKFGYSNLKTLPTEVPDHLKHSSLHLPKHMNEFLVRMLQVKKKALCRLLPCPVVKPDIRPSSLTRTGGQELVQKIHELCQKDAKHKQSLVNNSVSCKDNSPILKNLDSARTFIKSDPPAETAALLSKEILEMNKRNQKSKDETLNIELEPTLPSTKNMEDRDRFDLE